MSAEDTGFTMFVSDGSIVVRKWVAGVTVAGAVVFGWIARALYESLRDEESSDAATLSPRPLEKTVTTSSVSFAAPGALNAPNARGRSEKELDDALARYYSEPETPRRSRVTSPDLEESDEIEEPRERSLDDALKFYQ